MKRSLPVLLFLLLLASACHKNQDEYYIPDEFKNWGCFKPGTYWIYLNDKTGTQDCTWVKEFQTGMHAHGEDPDPTYYYEYFDVSLAGPLFTSISTNAQRTSKSHDWKDMAGMTMTLVNDQMENIWFSSELEANPEFIQRIYREYVFWKTGVFSVYPVEVINDDTFSNVYDIRKEWFSSNIYSYGDSLSTEAHLVKNIGIVKYRSYKEGIDTTWTLLRWKVVQ